MEIEEIRSGMLMLQNAKSFDGCCDSADQNNTGIISTVYPEIFQVYLLTKVGSSGKLYLALEANEC